MWAYCNGCQEWFRAGDDPAIAAADATCGRCGYPAVCLSDHGRAIAS
jgi:hypothetical protein